MMVERVLICYGTRYGSTAEVAEYMANQLREQGADVEVVDLKHSTPSQTIDYYSLIIIGSGIQTGRWTGAPLKFLKNNETLLSKARVAIFIVCGYAVNPDKHDMIQREFIDEVIAEFPTINPVSTAYFAGKFDMSLYNFIVRTLIKRIIRSEINSEGEIPKVMDLRDWNIIREWALELFVD